MAKESRDERHVPTRDICYAYAAAMHFAQAFEQNLRAFLYTMDYHGWIEEIPLTDAISGNGLRTSTASSTSPRVG